MIKLPVVQRVTYLPTDLKILPSTLGWLNLGGQPSPMGAAIKRGFLAYRVNSLSPVILVTPVTAAVYLVEGREDLEDPCKTGLHTPS